ncbi:MAG: serine/threonine-protein kinase [Verrucomicrobiota bacterium]|jgi:serine/threonine protein kinase
MIDPTSPSAVPPPISVPEHTMIRRIGGGGCGEVWLAKNTLGAYRAVKIVRFREVGRRHISQNEFAGILKFEPVSRLHDGLVDILQVGGGEAEGYFYYVMELADCATSGQAIDADTYVARTLSHDIRHRGRLPVGECIRLGAAIASALGFLHRQNLIHRDLKPSNIIFVNGFPKLADIGLVAGMSGGREYVGTEGFIPPEGCGTAQADLYSLGKVLYEMSTGNAADKYPVLPPDMGTGPGDLELAQFNRIILKACRTNPWMRYHSADELMMALLSFQFNQEESHRGFRGRSLARAIGVCGAVIGVAFVIFLVWRLIWLMQHTE